MCSSVARCILIAHALPCPESSPNGLNVKSRRRRGCTPRVHGDISMYVGREWHRSCWGTGAAKGSAACSFFARRLLHDCSLFFVTCCANVLVNAYKRRRRPRGEHACHHNAQTIATHASDGCGAALLPFRRDTRRRRPNGLSLFLRGTKTCKASA